jgi:hypothetical protein
MGSAKKKAATSKAISRPCSSNLGPSSDSSEALTRSTTRNKGGSNTKIAKAKTDKGCNRRAQLAQDDDVNDVRSNLKPGDDDSDDDYKTDDEGEGSIAIVTKTVGKSKPKKKQGGSPDPNGRLKGRNLVPWTRESCIFSLTKHLISAAGLPS